MKVSVNFYAHKPPSLVDESHLDDAICLMIICYDADNDILEEISSLEMLQREKFMSKWKKTIDQKRKMHTKNLKPMIDRDEDDSMISSLYDSFDFVKFPRRGSSESPLSKVRIHYTLIPLFLVRLREC
jgi:hypothetical protein